MKRSVILVDLDNVVYDWAGAMRDWIIQNRANRGMDRSMMDNAYRHWAVWDDWGIPEGEFTRLWRLGIEAGEIYAKGPLIPGARDALWRLSDAEWDIHIATARLTKFGLHDQIVINTATWLRDNNIPYRNIHFTDNKHAIRADAIVDDRKDNMNEDSHGKIYLFPANHIVEERIPPRVQMDTWKQIVKELTG
jgi:5'(3')-deoxyribonucleotidase